jgi:hypothetical protein
MAKGSKKSLACLALLLAGCSQYLVVAPEPRYAGQPHRKPLASVLGGTGAAPHPGAIATECRKGEQLAMVRVTRNFGQGLISWLTLGAYAPATAHYYCATEKLPDRPGEIDTNGGE